MSKNIEKNKYRIKNWKAYNKSLVQRGSLTVYIEQEAIDGWKAKPQGKQGRQKEYSAAAIEMMIMIRKVYHLRLRQLQGFISSVFYMKSINLIIPAYST